MNFYIVKIIIIGTGGQMVRQSEQLAMVLGHEYSYFRSEYNVCLDQK